MAALPVWMDAQDWVKRNPILSSGQVGFERETGKSKVGTGAAKWNDLAYSSGSSYSAPSSDTDASAGTTTVNPQELVTAPEFTSAFSPYRAGLAAQPQVPVRVVTAADSGWTQYAGTMVHDTTVFDSGTASAKLTTPGAGGQAQGGYAFTSEDWSSSAFGIRMRFEDWAKVLDGYILISTSGNLAQYFRVQFTPKMSYVVNGEWIEFTFTRDDFDFNSGSASWSTVNGIRVQIWPAAGQVANVWVDQIVRYPTPPKATISLAFDDGFATTASVAKPWMDKYGFRGTLFTITQRIGTNGYVSQAQIDQLASGGWDISGHADVNLTTMTTATAEADVAQMKKYLVDRGYKGGDVYAYANDAHTFAIRAMVSKYFNAARGLVDFGQTRGYYARRRLQGWQPGFATSSNLAAAKARVDRAISTNSWLILTFHNLPNTQTQNEDWLPADFRALMDYIVSKNVQVLPVSEALATTDVYPATELSNVPDLKSAFSPSGLPTTRLRAVAIGDSTVAGDTRTTGSTFAAATVGALTRTYTEFQGSQGMQMAGARSWFTHACLLSGGRLVNVFNAGLGNDRTPFMLNRFDTDIIAHNPDVVFLGGAHNDFSTGSGITEATTRANIQQMINKARAAGIVPILTTAYPDNAVTPYGVPLRRHNAWLKKIAQEQRLLLIDLYAAVVDPASTTGAWIAAYTQDGTHASYPGAIVAAQKVLSDLGGLLRGGPAWLPTDNVTDTNQLVQPLFMVQAATSGRATGWAVSGTGTTTMTTDAAVLGTVQNYQVTVAAAARLTQDVAVDGTKIKVGDRLRWAGRFKVVGAQAGAANWSLDFTFPGQAYAVRALDGIVGVDYPWAYFEVDAIVPAAATLVRVGIYNNSGIATYSLAQQGLYNLSTL